MAVETERKFLLRDDGWRREVASSTRIEQGYLANTRLSSIRLRIEDGTATLSVKAMTPGTCREEYEYAVPPAEALEMLGSLCGGPRVAKTRHRVPCGDHVFEVDEFGGDNAGLVVAEIELSDPGEPFGRPAWLGEEVTDHLRYYNFRLAERPFGSWPAADRQAAAAGRHLQAAGGEEP